MRQAGTRNNAIQKITMIQCQMLNEPILFSLMLMIFEFRLMETYKNCSSTRLEADKTRDALSNSIWQKTRTSRLVLRGTSPEARKNCDKSRVEDAGFHAA